MHPLLAVHISDNLLAVPWWLGGFGLMFVLMLLGALRLREEEVPRIALLTSAFFIASLIHVRVGPTSVHLLLNGLVGVVLGWRAALAIPIAVLLQAVLFGHGGFTTIGVNSCIMIVPAIAAGYLFAFLRRLPWIRAAWFRSGLVAVTAVALLVGAIASISLLAASSGTAGESGGAALENALNAAYATALQPLALALGILFAAIAVWAERRLENAPEFALGLLVGELTVLATVALNCLVLLEGGETNWTLPASLQVLAHLPIAVVEGIVLGFAVSLLARVRPDILRMPPSPPPSTEHRGPSTQQSAERERRDLQSAICNLQSVLLAVLALLALSGPARAHRLKGEYKILPGNKVRVESWFDLTGDSPAGAIVRVCHENGELLTEGTLDKKGTFLFSFASAEPLRIVISAGAGHVEELHISSGELASHLKHPESPATAADPPPAHRQPSLATMLLKMLMGLGIVAALATFTLAWLRRCRPASWEQSDQGMN